MKLVTLGTCLVGALLAVAPAADAALPAAQPITLGETMPDFTLPTLQGGQVALSSLRGKNVVLVFPRVQYQEGQWCGICNYAHLELAQLEQAEHIREAYDAQILVMVPFAADVARRWLDATPAMVAMINGWKHPKDPDKLDDSGRRFVERARLLFPADLLVEGSEVPTPFPVVLDANREMSGRLGLFQTEWGGTKCDQQIPTVMILDREGVVRYKHLSQDTFDRPSARVIAAALREVARPRASVSTQDQAALVATALDYAEGWYQGDAERMRRALHPELAKRALRTQNGREELWSLTRDDLVNHAHVTAMKPGDRIDVSVLDVSDRIATAKIVSPRFVDYVQLVRQDGRWVIVNVLWE